MSSLPNELLVTVAALSKPSPILPSSNRRLAAIATETPLVQWSWRNQLLLVGGASTPAQAARGDWLTVTLNEDYPYTNQLANSPLLMALRSRLPPCPLALNGGHFEFGPMVATAIAPDSPTPDALLSHDYVTKYLFASIGPFSSQRSNARQWRSGDSLTDRLCTISEARNVQLPQDGSNRFDDGTRWWLLLPDAVSLIVYFIRSGHLDLLEGVLTHLMYHHPALFQVAPPCLHWTAFMLDNRNVVRARVRDLVFESEAIVGATPLADFLVFLALLDWSRPTLGVLERAGLFSKDSAHTLLPFVTPIFEIMEEAMQDNLFDCPSAQRVIQVLDWIERYTRARYSASSPIVHEGPGLPAVFLELLLQVDLPKTINDGLALQVLGSCVAQYVFEHESELVLQAGLEHGLIGLDQWRYIRRAATAQQREKVLALVDKYMPKEQE